VASLPQEQYKANVATFLARLGERWDGEWLPEIMPGLDRLRDSDFRRLTDAELLHALDTLRHDLRERWRIHGYLLYSYQAASTFDDYYRATFAPTDPSEPFQMLQGHATRAHAAQCELWTLSRQIRASETLRSVFAHQATVESLRATDEGRALLDALSVHLRSYGWRADACMELAAPMWCDDPTPALNALSGLAACTDSEDPPRRLAGVAERSERLLRAARAKLAGDPSALSRFEALFAQASRHVQLDEDHNFLIDQMGNCGLRRPVLEVGRRLADRGAIASAEDVFFLTVGDLPNGFAGASYFETVERRRETLRRNASLTPPQTLGSPPDTDWDDPLVAALMKTDLPPPSHDNPPGMILGTPASPGIARGRAKVAVHLEQASSIGPGEILVCEMTLPPGSVLFSTAAAVVSDTGDILSHCATVAREYGIPCVVGTSVGTTRIHDGMMLQVDGGKGEVLLLDSSSA
jgi:pyruvate,water dikinase